THWWFTAINARSAGEPVPQAGPAVARTTDGGKTWMVFSDKNAPAILQMTFTDADHGWAMAIRGPNNTNNLLRTTDGGAHWQEVQVP
ncbi:MAG: Photosynthesis system assembly factor, partial [Chloroflexota bacterium]|nr:Photosynthesis system assembly factor [Chloroflexota bacterium]